MSRQSDEEPKKRMNRRIKTALVALVTLIVLSAGFLIAAYNLPILTVHEVSVKGNQLANADHLREISGVKPDENMFKVNSTKAADNVLEDPWVSRVEVDKKWPTTIEITVEEHKIAGYIQSSDGPIFIDESANAFLQADPGPGMIEFTGMDSEDSSTIDAVVEVVEKLPDWVRSQVSRVDAADPESIDVFFEDGRSFYFGSDNRLDEKIVAMETAVGLDGKSWNLTNPMQISARP